MIRMSNKPYIPTPVFDAFSDVLDQYKEIYANEKPNQIISQWLNHCFAHTKTDVPSFAVKDYQMALNFLYSYRGSTDTFGAYRRDVEHLLQWSWFVRHQSVLKHKREDIEDRKSVVKGKSVSVRVDLGGRVIITKKRRKSHK